MAANNPADSGVISRRSLFRGMGAAAALAALPKFGRGSTLDETASVPPAAESFRIAHLTDIHVQPELRADEGLRKCLAAVHELKPRPDLILAGGDLVRDALSHDAARVKMLFDLYAGIIKDSDIPFRQCIGNHDIFGWGSRQVASPGDPGYGKQMFQERFDLPRTTYSFDHKGWHFVMVDDILPVKGEGYEGGVTEEDMAWLDADLKAAGEKPKLLVAHIPFISVAAYTGSNGEPEKPIPVDSGKICRNAGPIMKLFARHKVNLALTGHLHCNERMEFANTTYIGEGAVCGNWWKGPFHMWPEGFGVVDLRADGTFAHQYHTYGWKAEKEAKQNQSDTKANAARAKSAVTAE